MVVVVCHLTNFLRPFDKFNWEINEEPQILASLLNKFFDTGRSEYGEWCGVLDLRPKHHESGNAQTVVSMQVAHRHDVQASNADLSFLQAKLGTFTSVK